MPVLKPLASWAEVGGATAACESADGGAAAGAGFALAVVDSPAPFVWAAVVAAFYVFWIHVEGRAMRDGFGEDTENRAVDVCHSSAGEARGLDERVHAREEENFRDVYVAESGNFPLID